MIVIVKFYNDYDQHGGYFVGLFDKSKEELEQEGYVFGRREPHTPHDFWLMAYDVSVGATYIFDDEILRRTT